MNLSIYLENEYTRLVINQLRKAVIYRKAVYRLHGLMIVIAKP